MSKTTQEKIAVMQHFEDGGEIEFTINSVDWKDTTINDVDWKDTVDPTWNWSVYDFRIKPAKPKDIWVNEYGDTSHCYFSKTEAEKAHYFAKDFTASYAYTSRNVACHTDVIRTAVHYREVIE